MSSKNKENRRLLATFKADEKIVINFLNMQDNQTNAIRYLIMKEVKENGYRNLNNIIPAKLTEEYFNYNFPELENQEEHEEQELLKDTQIINNELSISSDDNIESSEKIKSNNTPDVNSSTKENQDEIAECFLDPED